jgi:hypothetical protein
LERLDGLNVHERTYCIAGTKIEVLHPKSYLLTGKKGVDGLIRISLFV